MVTFQLLLGSTSTDIFKDKGGFQSLKKPLGCPFQAGWDLWEVSWFTPDGLLTPAAVCSF